jgi:hypothetical protein
MIFGINKREILVWNLILTSIYFYNLGNVFIREWLRQSTLRILNLYDLLNYGRHKLKDFHLFLQIAWKGQR